MRERTWYGARVYIDSGNDSGKAGMDDTYTKRSDKISDETECGERGDTSKADQYFFINAGSTEHIIEWFYLTPQKSWRFVFAEPAIRETSNGHCCVYHELDCIGMIYVIFCRVEQLKGSRNIIHTYPWEASKDLLMDEKIKMSAKPGSVVIDGCLGSQNAIWSKDILYECRLAYNTMGGFSSTHKTK